MNHSQAVEAHRICIRQCVLASLLLCAAACGRGKSTPEVVPEVFDAAAKPAPAAIVKGKTPIRALPPKVFDDGGDEARALVKMGALPAWSAVVERYRLLARRDQSGVISGRIVEAEGALRLIDTHEGMGSLSIPVEIPKTITLSPPARVLLWGAWHIQDSNEFVWRATRVEALSKASASPEFAPGLEARDKEAPEDLVLASAVAKRGGPISFVIVEQAERIGDGWLIADAAGAPPVARLLLPGERSSYGDQSRVTESERWRLEKNSLYWLEIGRIRPATDTALTVYRAITPPFRYSPPKDEVSP